MFLELLQGKDVLDLGCGSGDHALFFSKQGLNMVCIDISEEMIKICKEKGLNAKVMDIEDLKFEKETFDGIWAVTSLLHIPKANIKKVLLDLHKILKPEGILHICVKEGEGEKLVKDQGEETQRFYSYWKEQELIDLSKDTFKIVESRTAKNQGTTFVHIFLRKI